MTDDAYEAFARLVVDAPGTAESLRELRHNADMQDRANGTLLDIRETRR